MTQVTGAGDGVGGQQDQQAVTRRVGKAPGTIVGIAHDDRAALDAAGVPAAAPRAVRDALRGEAADIARRRHVTHLALHHRGDLAQHALLPGALAAAIGGAHRRERRRGHAASDHGRAAPC